MASKFYIGQKVKALADCLKVYYNGVGHCVIKKDRIYVVNDILPVHCSCPNTVKYLINVGIKLHISPTYNICKICNAKMSTNSDGLMFQSSFEALETEVVTDKYSAELALVKLLASRELSEQEYMKIMAMVKGDDEMFNLGKQIIEHRINDSNR